MGPRLREDDVMVGNGRKKSLRLQHPQPKDIHLVQRPTLATAVGIHRIRLQVTHIVKVIDVHLVRPALSRIAAGVEYIYLQSSAKKPSSPRRRGPVSRLN
jgi:hypothetical protein